MEIYKDGVMIICPSCIGLGKVMQLGETIPCDRCRSYGRVPGVEKRDGNNRLIGYEPKEA